MDLVPLSAKGVSKRSQVDLHEWIPNLSNKYTTLDETFLVRELTQYRGMAIVECKYEIGQKECVYSYAKL